MTAAEREGGARDRSVFCPACQAREGQSCTQPTDTGRREVSWVHLAREDAYRDSSEAVQ